MPAQWIGGPQQASSDASPLTNYSRPSRFMLHAVSAALSPYSQWNLINTLLLRCVVDLCFKPDPRHHRRLPQLSTPTVQTQGPRSAGGGSPLSVQRPSPSNAAMATRRPSAVRRRPVRYRPACVVLSGVQAVSALVSQRNAAVELDSRGGAAAGKYKGRGCRAVSVISRKQRSSLGPSARQQRPRRGGQRR